MGAIPNSSKQRHSMRRAAARAYAGDRTGSIDILRRGVEAVPTNPVLRLWLGYNQIALGNGREGLAEVQSVERQLGLNPPVVYLPELAYAYARLGGLRTRNGYATSFARMPTRLIQAPAPGQWRIGRSATRRKR